MISLGRKFGLLLAAVVFCFASSAFADIVQMDFLGGTGPTAFGEEIFPYSFLVTPISPAGPAYNAGLICDDFNNHISGGDIWLAEKVAVPNLPGSPQPYYWSSLGMVGYEEGAWLAQQAFMPGNSAATNADIQWAIWSLFDPATPPAGIDPGAAGWLAAAAANYAGGNYSNVYIYTPLAGQPGVTGPQEFIGVPEAHTSSLVAAGLLGLVALML